MVCCLLVGDLDGERLGLVALGLEVVALRLEVADQLVEVVGGAGADVEGDPAVLIAREGPRCTVGIGEQRAEHIGRPCR